MQGVGFDLLVVCGFAFDPHVSEEAKRYGKLTVLAARMNPDLAMGDELLKKTGAGNLFMVFGEPDIEIDEADRRQAGRRDQGRRRLRPDHRPDPQLDHRRHRLLVHRHRLQRRELLRAPRLLHRARTSRTTKLKRALRAEIDEAAWTSLYSTRSRPFDRPETGKIAVKVINHYGDEVLKVYSV